MNGLNHRLFDFAWLLLLILYILAGTPLTPFHADESTQIFMSRDYAYQFTQGDLSGITYSDPPMRDTEQHLRLLNGTINKYLVGLAWYLGGFSLKDINQQWDWGGDWNYNQQNGHAPSPELLITARWPSALFLAVGMVVIFVIGQAIGGRLTAYIASLYYALNPALLLNGHRAMMEGSLIFFILLTVLAGIWFLSRPAWWTAIFLGIASGLALASKHTAVFTVAAVFLACATGFFLNHKDTKVTEKKLKGLKISVSPALQWFISLLFSSILALITFYALNPAWWGDPIARAGTVLELRQDLLDIQTSVFGSYPTLPDALAGFARQTLIALPQYYEVAGWESYIGDQITRYEASPWHGVSVGGSSLGAALLLVMVGIGVWALFRRSEISFLTRWLVGLWALVTIFSTLALTPLEWQRYYLPSYPVIGLLAGLGIDSLMQKVRRLSR
jgi:4-amino-4-deoxy-L-arabinose transferase-like glycosyltransferase